MPGLADTSFCRVSLRASPLCFSVELSPTTIDEAGAFVTVVTIVVGASSRVVVAFGSGTVFPAPAPLATVDGGAVLVDLLGCADFTSTAPDDAPCAVIPWPLEDEGCVGCGFLTMVTPGTATGAFDCRLAIVLVIGVGDIFVCTEFGPIEGAVTCPTGPLPTGTDFDPTGTVEGAFSGRFVASIRLGGCCTPLPPLPLPGRAVLENVGACFTAEVAV